MRAGILAEADTFWQIRTGLLTIQQRSIPSHDTFSWTVSGQHWTQNSWGFNVVLALAYRAGGLPGVALLCAAVVALIGALVLRMARQAGSSPAIAAAFLIVGGLLLGSYLSARPPLADYVGVLILVVIMERIVVANARVGAVLLTGALTAVWVNLHAGALLAVGITGAITGLVFAYPATRARTGWCLAAVGAAAAGCLINPYGVGVLRQAAEVRSASSGLITEWRHIDLTSPLQVVTLVAGVIALVIAHRSRNVVFTASLALCVVAATVAIRFLPILLLLALPVLSAAASRGPVRRYVASRRVMLARGAALLVALLVIEACLALPHLGRPSPALYPVTASRAVPRGCKVFNTDLIGGYLILTRPDVLVSLDSRNDLYGRQRDLDALSVLAGKGDLTQDLAGADCVLVPPGTGLASRLKDSTDWKLLTSERAAVLFVRR